MVEKRIIHNPNTNKTYVMLCLDDVLKCIKLSGDFSKFEAWGGSDSSKRDDPNNYGAGILNTSKDKYRTERNGLFGEVAFHIMTGLPLDEQIRTCGNDWDFAFPCKNANRTLDVKNTEEVKMYFNKGEFIIKNSDWKHGPKKICPLKASVYFFTSNHHFFDSNNNRIHNFRPGVAKVIMRIHGAISARKISENREERVDRAAVRNATWDNMYIRDDELARPINFFNAVNLDVPSFLPYDDCIKGLWKGLESYV
jgi:hypothetical protein